MNRLFIGLVWILLVSPAPYSYADELPDQLLVELETKERSFAQWLTSEDRESEDRDLTEVDRRLAEIDALTDSVIKHSQSTQEQRERAIYRGRYYAYGRADRFDAKLYRTRLKDAVAQVVAICSPGSFRPAIAELGLIRRKLHEEGESRGDFLERMRLYSYAYPDQVYGSHAVALYASLLLERNQREEALSVVKEVQTYYSNPKVSRDLRLTVNRIEIIGKPAQLTGPLLSERAFDIQSLKGKVVLIDFWATWCGPCVRMTPRLQELDREYRERGLQIVGVSYDKSADPLLQYCEEKSITWPQIYNPNSEARMKVAEAFGVRGIPSFYLVDRQGIVRERLLGGMQEMKEAVERALGE